MCELAGQHHACIAQGMLFTPFVLRFDLLCFPLFLHLSVVTRLLQHCSSVTTHSLAPLIRCW